jgi:hypothetical protein
MVDISEIIEFLRQELPPIFTRKTAERVLGGIISARTLAKLDCQKRGPERKYISNTVFYERMSFLDWLAARLTDNPGRPLSLHKERAHGNQSK